MYVYLNNAATTKVDGRVLFKMSKYFSELYENPMTSNYSPLAKNVEDEMDKARESIAKLLNCKPNEIYFTSGGTESDNWAIKGICLRNWDKKGEIISTPIEHMAIIATLKTVEKWGFKVKFLPVNKYGMVDPDDLKKLITKDTLLVSVMHANNEIGTIEPIEEIGKICREKGIVFHTDAVQTACHIDIDVKKMNIDLLSLSAHKFYGPKGVGALFIREGVEIDPFMDGGHQEKGLRSGTHNSPSIIGMGEAVNIALKEMEEERKNVLYMRNMIEEKIKNLEGVYINGDPYKRLPNNLSISIEGVKAESLLVYLALNGIIVSAGAACSAKEKEVSHVLKAIGLPEDLAYNTIRISLGKFNYPKEIEYFNEVLETGIKKLRELAPR
ncbi:MAG: cysteine desulfurase family protein [Caldisericia bacterium]|jgi:cysteine desulfurase|nr:cysteine desulfurase family protein [Caldisericia bacterium]